MLRSTLGSLVFDESERVAPAQFSDAETHLTERAVRVRQHLMLIGPVAQAVRAHP
jgi:hypothetical protein